MVRASSVNGAAPTDANHINAVMGEMMSDDEYEGVAGTEWYTRAFTKSGRSFSEIFPVRFAEVGPNNEATMVSVAGLIQECACNHAQGIWGVAQSMPEDMRKANLTWVCTRLHLRMRTYPKWGDKVNVSTWFLNQGKIAARRDYRINDHNSGEQLGEATSQWVVFNLETRKMARIPQSVSDDFATQVCHDSVMEEGYVADKLPDVNDIGAVCMAPMRHYVRRNDLDMNGHVNNVVYVHWLLESVPSDVWAGHVLKEIILEYRSECNFGDSIEATCCELNSENGDQFVLLHKLERPGQGDIVRAKTVWSHV